jgi:hypothetical protein
MSGDPGFGMLHDLRSPPLHPPPARLGLRVSGEIVIEIEAPIQALGARVLLSRMTAPIRAAVHHCRLELGK